MGLKKKGRGSLVMVSEYLSQLNGRLRCTPAERDAYIAERPHSVLACKAAADPSWACDCRVIIEPGATKDKYFDNEQLRAQQQLAQEVFEASHFAPARDVPLLDASRPVERSSPACPPAVALGIREAGAAQGPVRVRISLQRRWVLHLPRVRCKALFLFDHSSGHERGDELSLNANIMPKGPDWNGKVPPMRDGWYVVANGRRVWQRMQFCEGDPLPWDVSCPAGIDPQKPAGAAAARPPSVQAEQLLGRQVVMDLSGLSFTGKLTEVREPDEAGAEQELLVEWDDDELHDEVYTVAAALDQLVGPPPDPEQQQDGPPTAAEEAAAIASFIASCGRARAQKANPLVKGTELKLLAEAEWPKLPEERRLSYVRKVRAKAANQGAAAAASTKFTKGSPVPPALWGRNKGAEAVLAERGLLPPSGLRASCESESAHGAPPPEHGPHPLPRRTRCREWSEGRGWHFQCRCSSLIEPPLGAAAETPPGVDYMRHLESRCCCKRLLAAQPDFRAEVSALEVIIHSSYGNSPHMATPLTWQLPQLPS